MNSHRGQLYSVFVVFYFCLETNKMISLNIYIACVYQLHICVYFSQPAGLDGENFYKDKIPHFDTIKD